MRVLLVEDNATVAGQLEKALAQINGCEVTWARSRDGALDLVNSTFFDIVILDRRIPSANDVLDDHADHGWRVFQEVREAAPGTPVWFLTGTEDADFASDLGNDYGRTEDIHCRQTPEQMYRVFWKKRLNECLAKVREFDGHLREVEKIAITYPNGQLDLEEPEKRTIKLFARRFDGSSIEVTALSGGLSGSRVLKLMARNAAGAPLLTAVAKIAYLKAITDEASRYQGNVIRLAAGGYPSLSLKIEVGAGKFGGLFYGMVGTNVESVFQRLANGLDQQGLPALLKAITEPWDNGKEIGNLTVAQIRRRRIGDPAMHQIAGELEGIDTGPIEAVSVTAAQCCQHNDLHCANVVYNDQGHSMVIDFGDVGAPSIASTDAVTLELSTVFHSQSANLPQGWPSEAGMESWFDLDVYTQNCAFAPFVRACRNWAYSVAGSQQEVAAVAYAYAVRQLKYQDTNKVLARALIRACIAQLT
ncbi:response regulator [Rhizobium mongolense]|uniref:CheY-like chemotaxis protein n=1 Tax=Rhizobium mongolense TaxID=57676 RepID=A0A7W6RPS7_9HYPH|nr:response regulator [Rhizobium mongolense]MBB4276387.1 CheY-like chemotaxis protein [Rhizobium mongolense]